MKNKSTEKPCKNTNMWVSLVVALALFGISMLSGFVAIFAVNEKDKNTIENLYNSNLYVLYDSLNNLETGLSKLMVSPDKAQNSMLLLDCYRQAEIAQVALVALPLELDSEQSLKIINQIGDYLKGYAASLARGKDCAKFVEQTTKIYDCSVQLKASAAQILDKLYNGEKISSMRHAYIKGGDAGNKTHHSVEYPELIYDGPFSDGKQPRHFKLLENKPEITQEEAVSRVVESVDGMSGKSIVLQGKSDGDEPCYELMAKGDNGVEAYFSVTVRGGMILSFSINRDFGKVKLKEDAARAIAEQAAAKLGYNALSVWYNVSGNVATVNLAPIIDGVIFYPDLVKVQVALDNGQVVGIEASGYCLNSCLRTLKPTMSGKAAESMVSDKLELIGTRLAVIPLGESEVLCYEVAGEYNGLQYFIYLDAHNGEELKILRVIDSYQGKLTI